MPPQFMPAGVNCPNCRTPFTVLVEQVLDVRADPGAKMRVLSGRVNTFICPHCRTPGAINLPILYHDADKELALVLMPMEAGRSDLERQQAIGTLTQRVLKQLPPEERKGYLLQPQVLLTYESLVNRILEADGVTPEMIEEQKARAQLLQRLLDAPSDEVLEAMVRENDEAIDYSFFQLLSLNLELASAEGRAADAQKLLALRGKLLELSSAGKAARARGEAIRRLQEEPSREKLLELLVETEDEAAREMLVAAGRPFLDYSFFQGLTARVEGARSRAEKERLVELRKEVLAIRDRMAQQTRAVLESRAALLRDLLLADDPERLARQRFPELDDLFLSVLATNLEQAQAEGEEQAVQALRALWGLVLGLMQEAAPPELQLVNRLMAAEGAEEVEWLLQEHRQLVGEPLLQLMEALEADLREGGREEPADHLAAALAKAWEMVGEET